MANKVKYGLCNVHYAKITKYDTETQKYTYDTPKPLPGAVSLSLDAEGSSDPFYADNIVYFQTVTNAGYSGDFELAMIPNDFRVDILGENTQNQHRPLAGEARDDIAHRARINPCILF